jgi:uncharacterized protein (DUF433 family)
MDWSGCEVVEIVPGKVSGAPILKGTRVQADTVLESHELGESVDEIAYSFDLDAGDVRKLLAFAESGQLTKSVR